MAKLPKLANTFAGVRATVGVEPEELKKFITMCLSLGVQVSITNEIQDKWIRCRVTMPEGAFPFFHDMMGDCCTILGHQFVKLMCPLPEYPEP